MGGDKSRAVNAVTMAVTGALGGQTDLQVAANTLAPYAAQVIGGQFGHSEDKNTAAQLASHAILGAALAYVNGGDPTAGGSAAVASEAAADYLTNQYKDKKEYQDANGEFQPNLLPEDVKTQIRDLTSAIGAVVGGTVGDSAFNAQLAGVVGQNAVENNEMSVPFPLNSQRGQGYESIVKYAQDKGLSDEETQKLIYEYGQPENKQAKEYIEGWVFEPPKLAASILVPELAVQKLEPIVVMASKSKWYTGALDTFRGWLGTESKIDADVLGNKVQQLDANTIRFSQNTVSFNKTDRITGENYTYDDLVKSMQKNGWQGDAVDVVKMPDGAITSFDNTRISAAREAGIDIKANVRNSNESLSEDMLESGRFGDAKTWGEAIINRINNQRPKVLVRIILMVFSILLKLQVSQNESK
ncbi:MAG: VENN motif pre-toxin domain-containing protein [Acinetobacter sp.]